MKVHYIAFILFITFHLFAEPFKLGLENIPVNFAEQLKKQGIKSVGLVTNQTGIDQVGNRNIDILLCHKVPLTIIFCPEHSITGTVPAASEVSDTIDQKTQLPIISLYGKNGSKKCDPELIKKVDLFIFDIQDVGMRHYTYISTLFELLTSAATHNKKVIVFDRPNPLGGCMEGPLVEPELLSFISAAPIPLRHGMTVGELARYFNEHVMTHPAQLRVIEMVNYQRDKGLPHLLVGLSPNIQSLNACHGYSFLGLLSEIRPFDVGIKTEMAFQCLLLPNSLNISNKVWNELSKQLISYGIHAEHYHYFSQRKKQNYTGLRFSIPNISIVPSFTVFLNIVQFFQEQGIELIFSQEFDKVAGTRKIQHAMNKKMDHDEMVHDITKKTRAFAARAQSIYLYKPEPILTSK